MAPDGTADPAGGIVQFVVGTGGAPLRDFEEIHPQSEARNSDVHGVLRLDLRADGYDFAFIPVEDGVFTDTGTGACHA
jgi:hypothetical protein